ncbi:hypothetical protein Barb4_03747 [Bacteroidales bacterium Barb4]|nr:hypothetical protein Barb4_03747 [Bacteroidales bacterium Barb4]
MRVGAVEAAQGGVVQAGGGVVEPCFPVQLVAVEQIGQYIQGFIRLAYPFAEGVVKEGIFGISLCVYDLYGRIQMVIQDNMAFTALQDADDSARSVDVVRRLDDGTAVRCRFRFRQYAPGRVSFVQFGVVPRFFPQPLSGGIVDEGLLAVGFNPVRLAGINIPVNAGNISRFGEKNRSVVVFLKYFPFGSRCFGYKIGSIVAVRLIVHRKKIPVGIVSNIFYRTIFAVQRESDIFHTVGIVVTIRV